MLWPGFALLFVDLCVGVTGFDVKGGGSSLLPWLEHHLIIVAIHVVVIEQE